ncbi:hypothetical protein [Candidatus Symbiobacter mobilis]|uniref:Uncharacterized protein n=1 Tax=Candidatus Symbiobacter mobilis CR TaxID=946483 RepID=U5NES6_9BURK|nr:hypothetical protein [Candidatus Symbiobacter mobilis]AGX88669.1 hypothetical protein Cenrod_2619 [Candidatus Symbiobacter mobilis CR]
MNVSSSTTPSVNAAARIQPTQALQANESRQDMRTQQDRQNSDTQAARSQAPVVNAQGQTTGRIVNFTA